MSFSAMLKAAHARPREPAALFELARAALAEQQEEAALPIVLDAARALSDARLWQWSGLMQRALDDHGEALRSFEVAARHAPEDQSIAHGHARIALEAGLDDAVPLYARARQLGQPTGDILVGEAAALLAAGRGEEAASGLDGVLQQAPLWMQGHAQLAQLRALLGRADLAAASLGRALRDQTGNAVLWHGLFALRVRQEDYVALGRAVSRARAALKNDRFAADHAAIAAAETGDVARADAAFEQLAVAERQRLAVWEIRHALRCGRVEQALALIDRAIVSDQADAIWPYAASAWRIAGDPRSAWLNAPGFVLVVDLGRELPDLDLLAATLRKLHMARGEHLDQSVRGGTQTDGPLFCRVDPCIRAVRAAVARAVERYARALPPVDPEHPLLRHARDRRVRFAGSWSVRLRDGGHHSNHVHPLGWVSSALYVALPERTPVDAEDSGWLMLGGAPPNCGVSLDAERRIEPSVGQLALFPSWLWHGTTPFAQGERITIAFDVACSLQSFLPSPAR